MEQATSPYGIWLGPIPKAPSYCLLDAGGHVLASQDERGRFFIWDVDAVKVILANPDKASMPDDVRTKLSDMISRLPPVKEVK